MTKDSSTSDSNIQWDIEELKNAYLNSAKEYDRIIEVLNDDKNTGIST
tara:strand:- start:201 stop:344 length:144 start_codon:yes stop_codon:yes gene_type:complete